MGVGRCLSEWSCEFFQTTHTCPHYHPKGKGLSGRGYTRISWDQSQMACNLGKHMRFFVMKTHSPALLSLGVRRGKKSQRSKIKILVSYSAAGVTLQWQENVNYVREEESDMHTDKLFLKWELQSSRRLQRDANSPSKGLVLLAGLKSQAILWLLKWKIIPKEMPDFY